MPEIYEGTRFRTRFATREPPRDEWIPELARWCRRFAALGLAPEGAGNLSFRSSRGFVVSRTAADLGRVGLRDFVEVLGADLERREVVVAGAFEPSSESLMHAAVYGARPGVNAVFHGHSDDLLQAAIRLGIPVTAHERPYGTPGLAAEVVTVLARGATVLVLRGHGFVSVGATMAEAGRRAEDALAGLAAPLNR